VKLLLWHWGRRGGGARYTLELARALQGRCDLAVSLSRQSELYDETIGLGLPDFSIDTYHDRLSAVLALARLPSLRQEFAAYLARERFDAVIATMHHIWCPAFLAPIARSGAKLIFVVHDASAHPGDSAVGHGFMLRREVLASQGLVALSAHVAAALRARFAVPADLLWVIPHPAFAFGPAPQGPRAAPPPGKPVRLVFFGRIKAYKGLDLLLEAVSRLQAERPVTLTIAGQGSLAPYAGALAALKSVRVINDWVAEGDVAGILDEADLLVAPYIEASQSGVIPSAYGLGLPVVATPIGGLAEQVRPGETGLLAAAPTAAALADAIRQMMDDPALYARCSAGALAEARGALSWEAVASAYLRVAASV
jgi:glycosyltransferase involved in cell wall biosynthesis